jgi:transposase
LFQGCQKEVTLDRRVLRDDQWERIAPLVPGKVEDAGRSGADNRRFVEAVLWIVRVGAPWRDLPEAFGNWNSVFQRFRRWARGGVFDRIFEALSDEADFEYVIVDGTIVRVHQHGTGAKGGTRSQAIGRSRGGLTTKIVALVDALESMQKCGVPHWIWYSPDREGSLVLATDSPAPRTFACSRNGLPAERSRNQVCWGMEVHQFTAIVCSLTSSHSGGAASCR